MKDAPRLHHPGPLAAGLDIQCTDEQRRYLAAALRLAPGDPVRVFNGRDGEFLCRIGEASKKRLTLSAERKTSDVHPPPDIDLLFAPLKHARLDYLVQKAVELGARRLRPVITQRTITERVNLERMQANAIEAAEQCNLVFVPEVLEPRRLAQVLDGWDSGRVLVFCDEKATGADPLAALRDHRPPAALLAGPEGGFTPEERERLLGLPFATAISLGPRVLRADTAAAAGLALLQAAFGDWHQRG